MQYSGLLQKGPHMQLVIRPLIVALLELRKLVDWDKDAPV
jgi:hypothetical protein